MTYIPKPHEVYKHFKGNLYQIECIAEHSETGEQLVIYRALYGDQRIFARPLEMFTGKVDREKYPDVAQEYRFELQNGPDPGEEKAEPAEEEELNLDPMLLAFLEADSYEEKLNILVGLHHRITDDMLTTMAVACDLELPEGELETRFASLKKCLLTMEKYECNRLR